MNTKHFYYLLAIMLCTWSSQAKNKKPNIIYLLADDAGYGDLSCYGQTHFETPNLDKLAKSGMKFTQHYSGSTVCSPSRSSLMTGQHTGHTPVRGNREYTGEGQFPIPADATTVAEMLKEAGYVTGAFGKWGIGYPGSEGDPNMQGFDEFFGYNCQRIAHRYYPTHLWHNQTKVPLKGNDLTSPVTYAQDVIQEETIKFIENNKDNKFFAYVPFILPHAELIVPKDSIYNKFLGKFTERPYNGGKKGDYGPEAKPQKYCSQDYPKAVFAAMMYRLDVYVGQIVGKLEELGIAENTIIMYASDNGPHAEAGADPKFFNSAGGLKGKKRDLFEGGIRTSFIVSWPDKVKKNTTSDHISAFWDVMPTLADVAGVECPKASDGISFLPTLLRKKNQPKHDYLYWEFYEANGRIGVRKDNWKVVVNNVKSPEKTKFMLFDLSNDEHEEHDVSSNNPEIVKEMREIIKQAHIDNSSYKMKLQ